MSRYIDYDALDYRNDMMHGKSSEFLDGVIYMAQRIEEAPSIDIVRCKECKYRDYWGSCTFLQNKGDAHKPIMTDADDFCSYGERKDHE